MKFEFDIEQVNVILSGLGELPAKVSMDLITSIHKQAEKQMQPEMVSEEGAKQPLFYNVGFVSGKSDVLGQSLSFVRYARYLSRLGQSGICAI